MKDNSILLVIPFLKTMHTNAGQIRTSDDGKGIAPSALAALIAFDRSAGNMADKNVPFEQLMGPERDLSVWSNISPETII